jgi:Transketolase, C-terminal subunit
MTNHELTWLPNLINSVERKSQRESYGKTLVRLGEDQRVVVLDADLSTSTHTSMFGNKFKERFFNMGISENNMIGVAAGLASTGLIPFASSFAVFATGRDYDFVRQSVCYSNQNVKIVATHAGLTVGEDGATHQMIEDLGLMSGLPNMTVISTRRCS